MVGLRDRLRSRQGFSPNDGVLASYVLDHPEDAALLSSRELAARTLTSPSAVQRFCRRLGFASYKEFQVNIVSQLKEATFVGGVLSAGGHAVTALSKVAELEGRAVEQTKRMVSPATIEEVALLVRSHTYVDIVARDANATMAHYGAYNLSHARKLVSVHDDVDQTLCFALNVPDDHVVMFLSRMGQDGVLVRVARMLRDRGVPTVIVTAHASSELAGLCDHVIEGYYLPEFDKLGEVLFGMVVKYVFDVLFVMTYAQDLEAADEAMRRFRDAFDEIR